MATINDGGPAFPTMDRGELDKAPVLVSPGMSLRAWFAGHAPPPPAWWLKDYPDAFEDAKDLTTAAKHNAAWRWAWADAMIATRGQP